MRSRSPLAAKKRTDGPSGRVDGHDDVSTRGRSREKGKGKNRDLSHALIKVSEVFGLELEEGKECQDGWKEFKKGMSLSSIILAYPVPHGSTVL